MATKRKPLRIFAEDDSPLEDLTQLYEQTQKAIAAGDLAALAEASCGAHQAEVDAVMADMSTQWWLCWSAHQLEVSGMLAATCRQKQDSKIGEDAQLE